jgi:hypothetical protein
MRLCGPPSLLLPADRRWIDAVAVVRGRQLAGIGVGAQLRIDDRVRRIVPDMLRLPIRAVIGDDDAAAIRGNGQGEVAIGVIGLQRGAAGLRDMAIGIERHRGGIAIGINDGGAIARVALRKKRVLTRSTPFRFPTPLIRQQMRLQFGSAHLRLSRRMTCPLHSSVLVILSRVPKQIGESVIFRQDKLNTVLDFFQCKITSAKYATNQATSLLEV